MIFLTSGCSFTGQQNLKNGWPVWLKDFGAVRNLGKISDSIILELIYSNFDYDCVIVMWSGLQRIDLIVDELVVDNKRQALDNIFFEFSGDVLSQNSIYQELIKKGNELTRGIRSLFEMIKLQNFLKSKGIKYYFMTYVNYWNHKDYVKNRNFGVYKYQELKNICKEIDFENFIFAENNDCIYETSLNCNGLESDDFHPSTVGYDNWMRSYVYPRLIKDKIIKFNS